MTSTGITPKLHTIDEAAAMLRLSRTVIKEQISAGRLRSVRQGRARRIPPAAVDEYVALLEREAEQERARKRPGLELSPPGAEASVTGLWPPMNVALYRDVELRPGGRYRGRVRWKDPATGRMRGYSHTFGSDTAAWEWIAAWTGTGSTSPVPTRDGSGPA